MSKTHTGYLLIADITGYTRYLSESELEHAQETLTALLELLVDHTQPPLVISRLAGDAVISYGLAEDFAGGAGTAGLTSTPAPKLTAVPLPTRIIEDTYVTFRAALDRLVLNNNCGCNACTNIAGLDLKFFVHFGSFGIQRIKDHDELVGSEVNLLHRLLKNTVTETTGYRAYALYTDPAVLQLEIADPAAGMTEHHETYEHLGDTHVWVQDLEPVWEARREAMIVRFPTEGFWGRFTVDIDLPPEVVWDYFVRPEFRLALQGSDKMVLRNRAGERIAPGSVYQCYHGDKVVPVTVLESHPPKRMIVRELSPMLQHVSTLSEFRFEPIKTGTRMTKISTLPTGPFFGVLIARLTTSGFVSFIQGTFEKFKADIEADYRERKI